LYKREIRIELYSSGNRIISPENQNFYNISITLHGFLMIFFLVMPGLFGGFGNYFVPIFQGSPEVVYPRVNNFSILILILSYLFVILGNYLSFKVLTIIKRYKRKRKRQGRLSVHSRFQD
jgi:heme/copper-type cytochrome/quinol oxidase subunit 1